MKFIYCVIQVYASKMFLEQFEIFISITSVFKQFIAYTQFLMDSSQRLYKGVLLTNLFRKCNPRPSSCLYIFVPYGNFKRLFINGRFVENSFG